MRVGSGAGLRRPILLFFVCAVTLLAVFGQLPAGSVFWTTLQNFAHCPAFIAISVILRALWPAGPSSAMPARPWIASAVTLGVCLLIGVGIEIAQSLFGGDVSVQDVLTDMAGAVTGLSAHALVTSHRSIQGWQPRHLLIAGFGTAAFLLALYPVGWMMAAVAHRSLAFPTLVSAESALDLYFLSTDGELTLEPLPAPFAHTRGERGIHVDLAPGSAGLFLTEPAQDWSGYGTLLLDMANPTGQPERVRLRVHDRKHNQQVLDRFNRTLTLPAYARITFRIELSAIRAAPAGRPMRLDEIAGLGLFDPDPRAMSSLYLISVRLGRARSD